MDEGRTYGPAMEVGIAGQIKLNPAVSSDGGESWRLRDGLGRRSTRRGRRRQSPERAPCGSDKGG